MTNCVTARRHHQPQALRPAIDGLCGAASTTPGHAASAGGRGHPARARRCVLRDPSAFGPASEGRRCAGELPHRRPRRVQGAIGSLRNGDDPVRLVLEAAPPRGGGAGKGGAAHVPRADPEGARSGSLERAAAGARLGTSRRVGAGRPAAALLADLDTLRALPGAPFETCEHVPGRGLVWSAGPRPVHRLSR